MKGWHPCDEGYELRSLILNRRIAMVTPLLCGFRGHVWDKRGYSTSIFNLELDARQWCEIELGKEKS